MHNYYINKKAYNCLVKKGLTIVISGPSGVGKGTVIAELMKQNPEFMISISTTTRNPRPGDVPNETYYFVEKEDFLKSIENNEFAEWAVVHNNYYGTKKSFINHCMKSQNTLILEIDIQGAEKIRQKFAKKEVEGKLISIFITPPSEAELLKRIELRGSDSKENIQVRMQNAKLELKEKDKFDFIVVNNIVKETCQEINRIIQKELEK